MLSTTPNLLPCLIRKQIACDAAPICRHIHRIDRATSRTPKMAQQRTQSLLTGRSKKSAELLGTQHLGTGAV